MGAPETYIAYKGEYKKSQEVHQIRQGVWERFQRIYVRKNGVYTPVFYSYYPEDAVAIFEESITADATWVNIGLDRMPRITNSFGSSGNTGGATTHTHDNPSTSVSGSYTHPIDLDKTSVGASARYCTSVTSHTHAIPNHTHGSDSNYPYSLQAKAYRNVGYVKTGMLIISTTGVINKPGWSMLSRDAYLTFTDAGTPGVYIGSDTHNHDTYTWETPVYECPTIVDNYLRDDWWHRYHKHYLSDELDNKTLDPLAIQVLLYRATEDGINVPSGAAILGHTSMTAVPTGYSMVSATEDGKFIKATSTTGDCGDDAGSATVNHSHTSTVTETDYTHTDTESDSDTNEQRAVYQHTHTWAHTHAACDTEDEVLPPWVSLPLLIKD